MRNVKFITNFAVCGFILSFVFGFFSHSSFIAILLKALIFGVVFVGLGFLISFIFDKFLNDNDSLSFGSDESSDGRTNNDDLSNSVGQNVDIVIKDEELTPSESNNHFLVGDNHQMLKRTDIKEDSVNDEFEGDDNTSSTNSNVTTRNAEIPSDYSGVETVTPDVVSSDSSDESDLSDENLDTLPNMDNFVVENNDSLEGGNDDDSYASEGVTSSTNTFKKNDAPVPEMKDASLYAKAISSILSGDDAL